MRALSVAALIVLAGNAGAQVPRLTPLLEFGCESCTGPSLFTHVEAITVAPDRRIIVVDKSQPHIRVFAADGRDGRAFGRTGQGPAELQTPVAVSVAPDGNIEVVDMTRRRLIRFGPDGSDKGAVALAGFANMGSFAPQGGHALTSITAPGSSVLKLIRVTGDGPTELLQVGDADFPQRPAGNPEALSIAVAPDGSFVVGDGVGAYVIRRYRADGSISGELRRAISKVRRTADEIRVVTAQRDARAAAMQARMGRGGASPMPARIPAIPTERNYFDAFALRFDETGRLWVRVERTASGHTLFDVFDPAGRYLGEVGLPVEVREFALNAGRLAAVVADDLGLEKIRVWTVDGR